MKWQIASKIIIGVTLQILVIFLALYRESNLQLIFSVAVSNLIWLTTFWNVAEDVHHK